MFQNAFAAGAVPGPCWGSLLDPRPRIAGLNGPLRGGSGGEKGGKRKKGKKLMGRGWERERMGVKLRRE